MQKIIDFKEAVRQLGHPVIGPLYRRARSGETAPMYELGLWLASVGAPAQHPECLYWLNRGAQAGYEPAQALLAQLYYNGNCGEQDLSKAARWYQASALQGNPVSMFNLGVMYSEAIGVARDYGVASQWYRKAASRGHLAAMTNLGILHYHGHGCRKSTRRAALWYRKAAEAGHPEALFNLGELYYSGYQQLPGNGTVLPFSDQLPQNRPLAFSLYLKAAEAGLAPAQFAVGYMYYKGEGCLKDERQAKRWLRFAAEQGNGAAIRYLTAVLGQRPALWQDLLERFCGQQRTEREQDS